jgi:hypothetical protein
VALQGFSLLLFLGYLVVGIKCFELIGNRLIGLGDGARAPGTASGSAVAPALLSRTVSLNTLLAPAAALFVFWPSNLIHSVRISNEPMGYLFVALMLLAALKWFLRDDATSFDWAMGLLLVGLLIKLTAIIAATTVLVALVVRFSSGDRRGLLRKAALLASVLLIGSAAAVGGRVILKLTGMKESVMLNTYRLPSGLTVGNSWQNYLGFDARTFLSEPFTSPWEDALGRQYFLSFLSKNSLFGQFQQPETLPRIAATVISWAFLPLVAVLAAGLVFALKDRRRDLLMLAVYLAASLAAITAVRVTYPVNIDFRYILPALIPVCIFVPYGLLRLRDRGWSAPALAGWFTVGVFTVAAALFDLTIS